MKFKSLRVLAALAGILGLATAAHGFKQGSFSSDKNHQQITSLGLSHSKALLPNFQSVGFTIGAVEDIQTWNAYTDTEYFMDPKYHFDEDSFYSSINWIESERTAIISNVLSGQYINARKILGQALHTIQDFYAHSNWVERHRLDSSIPHPDWGNRKPFRDYSFLTERATATSDTCDFDGLLSEAPLTTGYYKVDMSAPLSIDAGAYTNGWRNVVQDWPADHCVHGGDGHSHGINKDYNERPGYVEARTAAIEATTLFVNGILNEVTRQVSASTDPQSLANSLCGLLGHDQSVCDVIRGEEQVSSIQVAASEMYADRWFRVGIYGRNLSKLLAVKIAGGDCESPSDGSVESFVVRCHVDNPGSYRVRVEDKFRSQVLASIDIEIGPKGEGTPTLFARMGSATFLWLKDLYSKVMTAIWTVPTVVDKFAVAVTEGVSTAFSAIFYTPGEVIADVTLKAGLGLNDDSIKANIQVVYIAKVTPFVVLAGDKVVFQVEGENLPSALSFNFPACAEVSEVTEDTSTSVRRFQCAISSKAEAGITKGNVGSPGPATSPFSVVLHEFNIDVVKPVVAAVSAAPSPAMGGTSVVTVTGANLPKAANVLVDDATCDRGTVSAKVDGSGFTQTCTFGPAAGTKAVQVMSASDASGFVIDDSKTLTVGAAQPSSTVADTGVTSCTDYAFSPFSLVHTVGLDCALGQDPQGDPVPPRQDGATGRDALAAKGLLEKIGSGPGGFDFTKLDASGAALPAAATNWACVRDNHTKLVWENKASDWGLRDYRHRYTWYSTAADANGGYAGSLGSNTCGGTLGAACNTQAYVAALNAAQLCGGSVWRLPKLEELRSIANFGRVSPSIDAAWFSNTAFIPSIPGGSAVGYWSSNVYSANPTFGVMGMEFSYGLLMTPNKSSLLAARAVMFAQ